MSTLNLTIIDFGTTAYHFPNNCNILSMNTITIKILDSFIVYINSIKSLKHFLI